jgi:hypothetical protein
VRTFVVSVRRRDRLAKTLQRRCNGAGIAPSDVLGRRSGKRLLPKASCSVAAWMVAPIGQRRVGGKEVRCKGLGFGVALPRDEWECGRTVTVSCAHKRRLHLVHGHARALLPCCHAHARTHARTHSLTHTHTHTHARTHTYTRTHARTHKGSGICAMERWRECGVELREGCALLLNICTDVLEIGSAQMRPDVLMGYVSDWISNEEQGV